MTRQQHETMARRHGEDVKCWWSAGSAYFHAVTSAHHGLASLRCPECRDGMVWVVHRLPHQNVAAGVPCAVCDGTGWRSL